METPAAAERFRPIGEPEVIAMLPGAIFGGAVSLIPALPNMLLEEKSAQHSGAEQSAIYKTHARIVSLGFTATVGQESRSPVPMPSEIPSQVSTLRLRMTEEQHTLAGRNRSTTSKSLYRWCLVERRHVERCTYRVRNRFGFSIRAASPTLGANHWRLVSAGI